MLISILARTSENMFKDRIIWSHSGCHNVWKHHEAFMPWCVEIVSGWFEVQIGINKEIRVHPGCNVFTLNNFALMGVEVAEV